MEAAVRKVLPLIAVMDTVGALPVGPGTHINCILASSGLVGREGDYPRFSDHIVFWQVIS
jgi:hypothetical protein